MIKGKFRIKGLKYQVKCLAGQGMHVKYMYIKCVIPELHPNDTKDTTCLAQTSD